MAPEQVLFKSGEKIHFKVYKNNRKYNCEKISKPFLNSSDDRPGTKI